MSRTPNAEPDANNCWYGTEHCTLPHCDCVKRSNARYRTDERLRSLAAEARRGSELGWDVIGITDAVALVEELIAARARLSQLRAEASADKAKGGDIGGAWFDCECKDCVARRAATPTPTGARVAGEDEPYAWTIGGDDTADCNGFIPTKAIREGEFTTPLYRRAALATAPDPAAIRREVLQSVIAALIGRRIKMSKLWGMEGTNAMMEAIDLVRTLAGEPSP